MFFDEAELPVHVVATAHGNIAFAMFGRTTEFRVRTLLTKEPETVRWIDGFVPGEVFWDIGANIGCYSLYAAARGATVHAFEPSPVNFWLLARNARMNGFSRLTVFPFALALEPGITFWNPHPEAASAENQALQGGRGTAVHTQSIDALAAEPGVAFPTHLKIDVDGIERVILEGGMRTLHDRRVRSVLCEVTEGEPETPKIVDLMRRFGFREPVTRHAPYYDRYHYSPSFNYLFVR